MYDTYYLSSTHLLNYHSRKLVSFGITQHTCVGCYSYPFSFLATYKESLMIYSRFILQKVKISYLLFHSSFSPHF